MRETVSGFRFSAEDESEASVMKPHIFAKQFSMKPPKAPSLHRLAIDSSPSNGYTMRPFSRSGKRKPVKIGHCRAAVIGYDKPQSSGPGGLRRVA